MAEGGDTRTEETLRRELWAVLRDAVAGERAAEVATLLGAPDCPGDRIEMNLALYERDWARLRALIDAEGPEPTVR